MSEKGLNIMGKEHEAMKANKVIETIVTECDPPGGNIIDKAKAAALKESRPKLPVREALRLKISTGISYEGWTTKNKIENRTRLE